MNPRFFSRDDIDGAVILKQADIGVGSGSR
jgi:hypothetical protein